MTDGDLARMLGDAGVDLGVSSIAWGRHPEVPPSMEITSRDRRILATVHNLGYLTTSMLALLFWGKQTSAAHVRLKLLHDAGYLDKLRPRVRASKASREWIYRLSARGWHQIVAHAHVYSTTPYHPADLTSISYVEHDLQLNALVLHVAVLAATQQGWNCHRGGLLEYVPFEILGPRDGVIDPRQEARPRGASKASELGRHVVRRENALPGRLEPDATLIGVDRHGQRTAILIEYDRTRRPHKQIQKLRRYDHFLTDGWRQTRYAMLDVVPAVLFVCASDAQILSLVRTADQHLTAWHGPARASRTSSEHVGREQIAVTSRARLMGSDWRVLQPPRQPSDRHRTAAAGSEPITVDLPLPSVFASQRTSTTG